MAKKPKCIAALQEELEERRSRSGVARMRRFREEISGSAVERIAQSVNTGPLMLLRQCQFGGARVKLVTRHSRGVRGTCTGEACCSPRLPDANLLCEQDNSC